MCFILGNFLEAGQEVLGVPSDKSSIVLCWDPVDLFVGGNPAQWGSSCTGESEAKTERHSSKRRHAVFRLGRTGRRVVLLGLVLPGSTVKTVILAERRGDGRVGLFVQADAAGLAEQPVRRIGCPAGRAAELGGFLLRGRFFGSFPGFSGSVQLGINAHSLFQIAGAVIGCSTVGADYNFFSVFQRLSADRAVNRSISAHKSGSSRSDHRPVLDQRSL